MNVKDAGPNAPKKASNSMNCGEKPVFGKGRACPKPQKGLKV